MKKSNGYSKIDQQQVEDDDVASAIELAAFPPVSVEENASLKNEMDSPTEEDPSSSSEYFMDEPTTTATIEEEEGDFNYVDKTQIQLYRLSNIAIPLNYFLVGIVQGLAYPLLNVYSLDLGATEAQQLTLMTLKGLPSCFKILFGFWSDNIPVWGYRRKPYLFLGWFIAMISLLPLLLGNDLTLSIDYEQPEENLQNITTTIATNTTTTTTSTTTIITTPPNTPTMGKLSTCFFCWAMGVWISDVMGDSLVAEKAKYEHPTTRGDLQVFCYIMRGLGFAMLSPLSSLLYATPSGPLWIITATFLVPILHMPFIFWFAEIKGTKVLSTQQQVLEIWNTVCSRAVWQPMGFVYLHMTLFVSNSAWKQYLESVLGFTPTQLNILMIISGILAFGGIILYKLILIRWSWRLLFAIGMMINACLSIAQLLLIKGQTWGISPFVFALGDDAMMDFLVGTQYLPMTVMMVNLVPTGIEGASYALFTTTWNAALALADSISTMLLGIWDVSKDTLVAGEKSGMIKLTLLTTGLQSIPILFVWLLPNNVTELQQMNCNNNKKKKTVTTTTTACADNASHNNNILVQEEEEEEGSSSSGSAIGGAIYLTLVFFSVGWAIFVSIMNIFHPGWMGES